MSSPGGSGGGGSNGPWNPRNAQQPNDASNPWATGARGQRHDPLTGRPLPDDTTAGGPDPTSPAADHPWYGQPNWQQGHGPQGHRDFPGTTYRGFGIFDPGTAGATSGQQPPEPPRKHRGPLIAALAATAVVLVAATTTIVLLDRNDAPGRPVAQRSTPPSSTTAAATPPAGDAPKAEVAGWRVVRVPERGAVYDAPSDWELHDPEGVIGFGPPEDAVTMTGVAVHEKGFCSEQAGSFRAISGATAREGTDDAGVAAETAGKLAELAYTVDGEKPRVTLSPPQPLQLAGGAMAATRVVATVTPAAPEPCGSPSVLVSAVATNNDGNSSIVHLTIADQGVPEAVPPEAVHRIGESFRPAS